MSSGEVSGDHYTACIAKELRKNGYRGELWGMGGRESKEAGVRCAWNGEQLQLLGVVEVLRAIPRFLSSEMRSCTKFCSDLRALCLSRTALIFTCLLSPV
jgi:Lipid A disaccharide synthetase